MYKRTTTHSAGVVDKAREIWGDKVFRIEVPETISFPRAYTAGLPLTLYDPEHEGALAYLAVARLLYPAPEVPPATVEAAPAPLEAEPLSANEPGL
jgi:cellulose biosynthesis protein BcsQ